MCLGLGGGGWTLWTELNLHPYAPSEACFHAAAVTADRCPRSPDQLRGWCWSCRWARVLQNTSKAAGWLAARCCLWRRNEAMIWRFSTRSALKQHWNLKKASPSTRRTWDPLSWTDWTTAGGVHRFLLQLSVCPWRQHPPDGRCCQAN